MGLEIPTLYDGLAKPYLIEGSLNSNFRQYGELKSRDEKQMR